MSARSALNPFRIGLTCLGLAGLPMALPAASLLPDMGNSVDEVLSPTEEARLGEEVLHQLRAMNALLNDPLLDRYLQSLGQRLVSQSTAAGDPFLFFAVRDSRINAFALPGGYVGVNTGLIIQTRNESELAGVLAHEVSHVSQRHIARRMADSRQANILTGAAMVAAILAGAGSGNPQMVQGAVSAGMAATVQNAISFTLQNEKEADRIGMRLLADAGFDPNGMPSFFELMAQQSRFYETAYSDFLRTHPLSTERISEATDRARMVAAPKMRSAPSRAYLLMRARARALTGDDLIASQTAFRTEIDRSQGTALEAARYGLGLTLLRQGQHPAAVNEFTALVRDHPEIPEYRQALGEAQQANGQNDAVLATYQTALNLFPGDSVLSLGYARALLLQGKAQDAYTQLEALPATPEVTGRRLRLLAQAAEELGRKGEAHVYLGEYLAFQGQTREAIMQMTYALQEPDLDDIERTRVENRRKALARRLRAQR
ncbi:MAG: M48 family metalloprotease [Pseudomonadota bacterium]|nr:M48 family metalloprotease [Pseudomonadota bacterium]